MFVAVNACVYLLLLLALYMLVATSNILLSRYKIDYTKNLTNQLELTIKSMRKKIAYVVIVSVVVIVAVCSVLSGLYCT